MIEYSKIPKKKKNYQRTIPFKKGPRNWSKISKEKFIYFLKLIVFQINIFKNLIEFLQDKILRFSRSNIRRFQKRKNYQKTIRFKRGREIDRKFLKKILFTPSSWSLLD